MVNDRVSEHRSCCRCCRLELEDRKGRCAKGRRHRRRAGSARRVLVSYAAREGEGAKARGTSRRCVVSVHVLPAGRIYGKAKRRVKRGGGGTTQANANSRQVKGGGRKWAVLASHVNSSATEAARAGARQTTTSTADHAPESASPPSQRTRPADMPLVADVPT